MSSAIPTRGKPSYSGAVPAEQSLPLLARFLKWFSLQRPTWQEEYKEFITRKYDYIYSQVRTMPRSDYDYIPLPIRCNLSQTSLEEAQKVIGPSFLYTLRINPQERNYARDLVYNKFPLAPIVNIILVTYYDPTEWSLHANERACGSLGV